jgi:excisionase family DNA binding protein
MLLGDESVNSIENLNQHLIGPIVADEITGSNWSNTPFWLLLVRGGPMRQFGDVLKAEELSRWLRIPKSTIYKLCLEGKIPGTKIGRHWRFDRHDIEVWFKKNNRQ